MPKFEKTTYFKKPKDNIDPTVFIPEDAEINLNEFAPLSPPKTMYEKRRSSIGKEAFKKVTGK